MGHFLSELEDIQAQQSHGAPPPGASRGRPVAAFEGGPLAHACIIRWGAIGSGAPDWIFDGSLRLRAWPRRPQSLVSGASLFRFELQAKVQDLTALGITGPWVVAAMHPWSSDWYADSPARTSPDSRQQLQRDAEASGDVATYQRRLVHDLFCTDKAWRTAVIDERRIAPQLTTGRVNPPDPPEGAELSGAPWRNPYYCIGLCSDSPAVAEHRRRLGVEPSTLLDHRQDAPAPPTDVVVAALLRHPVADELRALTRDRSLFERRNLGLVGRRVPRMYEVRDATAAMAEDVLEFAARKALAGPPVTDEVYRASWSGRRTVASFFDHVYVQVLYAVNARARRNEPASDPGAAETESGDGELEQLMAHAEEMIADYGREAYDAALDEALRRRKAKKR